MDFHAEAGNI